MPAHRPDQAAVPVGAGRVLVVGPETELRDEVHRLAAATGVPAQTIDPRELGQGPWADAALVVIDAGCADQVSALALPRRAGVLIIAPGSPSVSLWAAAVSIGVEQVLELPAGQAWLAERLSDVASGPGPLGTLIAVIGGCGGAGASTLAVALALSAAASGHQPVLIGADPWDGGLDITLGAEDVPGPRWPDLATVSGRLSSAAILDGLPQAHGVRFLSSARSHPSGPVPLAALSAVVTAAVRTGGPVVLDLPRAAPDIARGVGAVADLCLMVCSATVSGVLAARSLSAELGWAASNSGIVVRVGLGSDIDDVTLASTVGLPVLVRLREETQLVRDSRQGEPPGRRRRSRLARSCADLWQLAAQRQEAAA